MSVFVRPLLNGKKLLVEKARKPVNVALECLLM